MANDKDIIKSVRVRKSLQRYNEGLSDIKVTIYKDGLFNNKRKVEGKNEGTEYVTWQAITYDLSGRYDKYTSDEFIKDFISTNSKLQGGEFVKYDSLGKVVFTSNISVKSVPAYKIVQDPWSDSYSPKYRGFGFDYYFLNNGAYISIEWTRVEVREDGIKDFFVEGGEEWSDDSGNELDTDGKLVKSSLDTSKFFKRVQIRDGRGFYDNKAKGSDEIITLSKDEGELIKYDGNDTTKILGKVLDKSILDNIVSLWSQKIPSYQGKLAISEKEYTTKLDWISPINPPAKLPEPATENNKPVGASSSKIKLNVVLPPDFKVVVKQDTKDVKVYVGDPPKVVTQSPDGFIYQEENNTALADEYSETQITISDEDLKIQDEISNSQEDCSSPIVESPTDGNSVISDPVVSKPLSSLDALLDLAGECARALGKNARVNAENMKMKYTKGIHGLCPQGTQAVLYALTGVKSLGQISGNADWFSFGPTNPSGGDNKASFSKSGYFQDKVKVSQISGTWKGTYLTSKKMWQVGDVVAMAYSDGKDYGHIQVWTGHSWMSDFRQGDNIQQNHVNGNSVALWRLNEKGLQALKSRTNTAIA